MNLNLTPQKIRDPFVAEWALHRLRDIHNADIDDDLNLEELFSDVIIWEIISENKSPFLIDLFHGLPPEKFANLVPELCRLWPKWSDMVSSAAAEVISKAAPKEFLKLADKYIRSFQGIQDWNQFFGIIDGLSRIESPAVKELAEKLIELIYPELEDERFLTGFYPEIFYLAYKNKLPNSLELFLYILKLSQKDADKSDYTLIKIYSHLTGGLPYLNLIHDIRSDRGMHTFIDLSVLFQEDTPLSEFDDMVNKPGEQILKRVMNYLPPLTEKQFEIIEYLTRAIDEIDFKNRKNRTNFACFVLGLVISLYAREKYDLSALTLDELVKIASFDIDSLPCYEQIVERIGEFPKNDIIEEFFVGLAKAHNTFGEVHLLNIMGSFKYPEFIETFIACMGEKRGDYACEAAKIALERLGSAAESAIIERWDTLDSCQKIYSYSVLELTVGEKTVQLLNRIELGKDLNWEEMWCYTALGTPDLSLAKYLEPELKRKQFCLDDTYLKLCLLLDYNPPYLSEIRERVITRKAKSEAKMKTMMGSDLENIVDDKMSISLVCQKCDKENRYEVENVFIDPTNKKSEPFIGDDLECLTCGAKKGFYITNMGQLALTAELLKMSMVIKEGREYDGPLKMLGATILGGKKTTLPEALDYYEKALSKDPENVENLLGYANVLKNIGRTKQAKKYYLKCLKSDPCCVEASLNLAKILGDEGQFRNALNIMKESLKYKSEWRLYKWHRKSFADFEQIFLEEYNALEALVTNVTVIKDIPFEPPPQITAIRKSEKIGRNEPCPCGSGKKYKHCCMQK